MPPACISRRVSKARTQTGLQFQCFPCAHLYVNLTTEHQGLKRFLSFPCPSFLRVFKV